MSLILSGNSKELDEWRRWRPAGAGGFATNAYFDYYYSGADVKVTFSDVPEDFGGMEIVAIGYNIVQQKVPIYGFWSYCVDTETEALTKRGWLKHSEITEKDEILSMRPRDGQLVWSRVKGVYRDLYDGYMHHITGRSMDALVTPGHNFATSTGKLVPIDKIRKGDQIRTMGLPLNDQSSTCDNSFVGLVGQYVTMGRVRSRLYELGLKISGWMDGGIETKPLKELKKAAPERVLSYDFIAGLSTSQRRLLINTIAGEDNGIDGKPYKHKSKKHMDVLAALCAMQGVGSVVEGSPDGGYVARLTAEDFEQGFALDFNGGYADGGILGKRLTKHKPTRRYQGIIWCPQTEYGTFVCRRGGKVYVTGNTYDAIAFGTRIVQGTFAIPFKGPHFMYMALQEAANKYDKDPGKPRVPLSEDDVLLDRYWGITRDEKTPTQKHIFLAHPPFDIIISYGQESYEPDEYFDMAVKHPGDEITYGINERFVNPDDTQTRPRIFIENVNLTNMGMQIEPTGQPLMEAYTFFARDIYWEGQEKFHNK